MSDFRHLGHAIQGLLRFAVTAPWGVVFEKNIVLIVQNDLFVVVGHDDLNGTLLFLRNRLRLDARVNLAVNEVLHECANIIVCKLLVLVKRKFLVLDGLLDGEGGPLAVFEVQIASVCAEGLSVDGSEAEDSLVFLCKGLELSGQLSALLRGFSKDVSEGNTSLGIY